ncbi:MAG: chorismate synthase [Mycoplasmatales bacterium]
MFRNLKINIYGTSHDKYIGCTVTGLHVGHIINMVKVKNDLSLRQGNVDINTARVEENNIIFLQGVEKNKIIDNKISFVIENKNINKKDYLKGVIRPGHADYIGYKMQGLNYNYAGGGKFSGRLTTLYVIVGSICEDLLDMKVYGHIKQVGNFKDDCIKDATIEQLDNINNDFPMINKDTKKKAYNYVKKIKKDKDSVGALLAFRITNPIFKMGGYDFESFESYLSSNLFAIGAIKGINFGLGNDYITSLGSFANDSINIDKFGVIISEKNHGGGINGGFTNGYEDILFECIIRPTPSIFKEQKTIKLTKNGFENYTLNLQGRHDTLIANRALYVIKAMTYITIYDLSK